MNRPAVLVGIAAYLALFVVSFALSWILFGRWLADGARDFATACLTVFGLVTGVGLVIAVGALSVTSR